jgi:hypothetical protein
MDEKRWLIAWSQLDAFRADLPQTIDEKLVGEFHQILTLFQESSGEDLSTFKVPGEDVKAKLVSSRRMAWAPGQLAYSDAKFCNRDVLLRKIDGLKAYLRSLFPTAEPQRPKMGFHS